MAYLADVPKFGFGTAYNIGQECQDKTPPEEFKAILKRAIDIGCRHIDCAPLYGTQELVGQVLKQTIESVPRKEFFVASKLPVNMMREENIEKSLKRTLAELQLTYLDLFLIHAPFSTKYVNDNEIYPLDSEGNLMIDEDENLLEKAWMKLVDLKSKGLVKYIGLCNVNMEQVLRLNKIHQVDVAQNEYHLFNQDREFFDNCEEIDVHYEAYAGLGCPPKAKSENKPTFLTDPVVTDIAHANGLSNAQVMIQWLHQQPLSYVIRSDNIAQVEENFLATTKRTLSINDMIKLDSLNQNARLYLFDNFKGISRHKEYPFNGVHLRGGTHDQANGSRSTNDRLLVTRPQTMN